MKKIYIVLTQTGTLLSTIIKYYSKKEYNHVSLSLDSELNELYSFGRLNPYNAFSGGFVHEGIDIGTFKRFTKTKAKIYALEVTEAQYEHLVNIINHMYKHRKKYKFNRTGLVLAGFNKDSKSTKKFYCSDFVKYALRNSDIDVSVLPKITHPEDFTKLEGMTNIYKGYLKDYKEIMQQEVEV